MSVLIRIMVCFLSLCCSLPISAEIKTVMVGKYSIEYELSGVGNFVVLLEAGGASGLNDWDPIYNELSKRYRTIRYSLAGNGSSSNVRKNYSSEEYALKVRDLLTEQKLKIILFMSLIPMARTSLACSPQCIPKKWQR